MDQIDFDEKIELILPKRFLAECAENFVTPDTVIRGFVADLSCLSEDGYYTNGSDERMMADDYFQRCCYGIMRENLEEELKEKSFQLAVEKIKIELADNDQNYIQESIDGLVYEALSEVYPAVRYHLGEDEFAEEIMERVRKTDVFHLIPEDWSDWEE